MDKKYTPDEIIADLKELIAAIEDMRDTAKPEMEQAYTFTRQLDHITDKKLGLQMQLYVAMKNYGEEMFENGNETAPDGAASAEQLDFQFGSFSVRSLCPGRIL